MFSAFIPISDDVRVMGDMWFVLFSACVLISDDFQVITDWKMHNFLSFSACFSTIIDGACCRYSHFEDRHIVRTRGRHSHWKVEKRDVPPSRPPFFRQFLSSRDPPISSHFPAPDIPLLFFDKFNIFKPNFCWFQLNFSSWNTNFSEN